MKGKLARFLANKFVDVNIIEILKRKKKKKTTSKPITNVTNVNYVTDKRTRGGRGVIGLQPPSPRAIQKLSIFLNRMFFKTE